MVSDWVIATAAIGACTGGAVVGWQSRRIKSKSWLGIFFSAIVLVIAITIARRYPMTRQFPPLDWIVAGRTEHILLAGGLALMICTLMPRLQRVLLRWLLAILLVIAVGYESVSPFVLPPFLRDRHAAIVTQIDINGVCRQQTDYTCGPASAVSALLQCGITTKEGDLANLLHTTPAGGTELDIAAAYLEDAFASQGVHFQYRVAKSVRDLPMNTPILAVRYYNTQFNHIIAIQRESADQISIRDPLTGLTQLTNAQFDPLFEGEVIVLTRRPSADLSLRR